MFVCVYPTVCDTYILTSMLCDHSRPLCLLCMPGWTCLDNLLYVCVARHPDVRLFPRALFYMKVRPCAF